MSDPYELLRVRQYIVQPVHCKAFSHSREQPLVHSAALVNLGSNRTLDRSQPS